ncbi:MAG: single-stranded DNA-binding protein [Clostridia bacterium]|nr:single-stranded DNA-binding protein [Clostridia bacterium]
MVNIGVIMGRLTADPELRVTPSGTKTTSFTVAVDRRFTQNGERQADFIDVVAWRHDAEFICKNFRKGTMIAVQGRLQSRSYKDKNGFSRKALELIADAVSFCGDKGASAPGCENIPEYKDIPEVME